MWVFSASFMLSQPSTITFQGNTRSQGYFCYETLFSNFNFVWEDVLSGHLFWCLHFDILLVIMILRPEYLTASWIHLCFLLCFCSEDICNKKENIFMCPLCDKFCDIWKLDGFCFHAKFTYLVDNPSTIFFTAFMSLWGKFVVPLPDHVCGCSSNTRPRIGFTK